MLTITAIFPLLLAFAGGQNQSLDPFVPRRIVTLDPRLDSSAVRPGDRIGISCEVRNRSGRSVTCSSGTFFLNYRIIVQDQAGNDAKPTDFGRKVMSPVPHRSRYDVTVKAGQSHPCLRSGVSDEADLAKLFVLKPGTYRVFIEYLGGDPGDGIGPLRSSPVLLEISPL